MARMKRKPAAASEQLSVFAELGMPDALLERVEEVARGRGVSPSSLMRALIAAGLDRSYAAITPDELSGELAALRKAIDEIATRLRASE